MGIVACTADLFREHLERLKAAGHEVRLSEGPGHASLGPMLSDADALICLLTDLI